MLEYEVLAAEPARGEPKRILWLFKKGGHKLTVADILYAASREFKGIHGILFTNLHVVNCDNGMILEPLEW